MYDGNNALLMRFEYADARMPFAMTMGSTTYFLTYDQVGSLRTVVNTSGVVVKQIEYDSFGNIISETNQTLKIPFGFAGGLYDRDTGFVRFGYRDYDPDTGRWTAKDPIGFGGGDTDLYGYCVNDPVNLIDPYGLEILVCNRKARGATGFSGGNHAYAWNTEETDPKKKGYGMQGMSGSGEHTEEEGPTVDACTSVKGSKGKEQDVMSFLYKNADNGLWFPVINDCHNAVKDAVEAAGLEYPGAPGGRWGKIPNPNDPVTPKGPYHSVGS